MTLIVDVAFERVRVFPKMLVVVKAFEMYKLPVILAVAFERVSVFANTLVVVKEFETAKFVKRPTDVILG